MCHHNVAPKQNPDTKPPPSLLDSFLRIGPGTWRAIGAIPRRFVVRHGIGRVATA